MKTLYILIIGLFVVTSCGSPDKDNSSDKDAQTNKIDATEQSETMNDDVLHQISDQWILVQRKSLRKDTTLVFSPVPPSIITEFKISGYFGISDLIDVNTDQGKTQKLENRVTGQWELNDNQLVMRFGTGDSTHVSTYQIEKVNADSLVLKNIDENVLNTYAKRK